AHKLRCLFRVAFVPPSAAALAQRDLNALDYLFTQCCNDVIQERFAPELQYDTALRLAALHIYQHALANNIAASKLTVKTIEREFGLERFVPASLLESMKRKEVRKLVAHFLKLHSSMAGPGKQLTALQAKLHYLDIVGQLPSYGAKCFSAGPRADALERVILVSPKFGISQITGTRNSVVSSGNSEWSPKNLIIPQPVPIANIEDMRRIEVRTDDEVSRTVLIRLQNEKTVSISLEERDASELVLVLRGYFRLTTGQVLPVDQEESPPMEDLAPPYLSQHKVVPEKWSYTNQISMKSACFTMPPTYQMINRKTNGLYNTMGRQSKPPLMLGYSLDSNMNSSLSNRNHQFKPEFSSFDNNSYDLQTVVSMEILESGTVEARNDEVLKRVQEMQQLVENSEKYLTEQENLERLNALSEWQETSVDIESDTDSLLTEDAPGKLKHSDSLLLLAKGHSHPEIRHSFTNAAIELLRSESNQSESDNDSLYTPHNSPKHKVDSLSQNKANRVSFGLRSPDNSGNKDVDFQAYLQQLRELRNNGENAETLENMYVFDPDIIDLTLLPPPATPDELDCALPTPINVPPSSFADSVEKLNDNEDLEKFLASVTVPPPTQKVTPAIELTPEEIMSYIIPPPPKIRDSFENLTITEDEKKLCNGVKRRNSNCSVKSNIIEYATVDRKGAFSCCAKSKSDKPKDEAIQPLPRRSSDEKPPERPPKNLPQERQRSHSLTSTTKPAISEFPPKLPPRTDNNHQAPPHLFLPPKKPPLPPVPPLEVLRQKKSVTQQPKLNSEVRTAGIGSPHLQRNRNMYNDLEPSYAEHARHTTAISTPTSPHLGRGAQLTAVPIMSPDSPNCSRASDFDQKDDEKKCNGSPLKNGCTSTREILLAKTDVAMASLLVRLDQVAAQCSAAQVHGGGRLISEEKF
ncbi:FERM and PDZ domain-containing protein 4, partial [Asbolus verrucosus]